ncbi:hypothetical protein MMPV_006620 [Pyropia vietnamensis]
MSSSTRLSAEQRRSAEVSRNGTSEPPAMRYSSTSKKSGLLLKRGKFLHRDGMFLLHKKSRYLVLEGPKLSCYKKKDDDIPEYEVTMPQAEIDSDPSALELIIILPHRTESYFAENLKDFEEWLGLLTQASRSTIKDHYALVAVLGEGHFGRVYLGKDRQTYERFAVKVLRKSTTKTRSHLHIQRELEILRRVNHPNIVRLYDLFVDDQKLYFVLEYMPGGALFDLLAEHKTFSEELASSMVRDILRGLAYLHAHNIVHRDLKPDNILCSSSEWPFQVKLADFGLSNMLDEEDDSLQSKVGTPLYCSPELLMAAKYNEKIDCWAAGILMYELLTGTRPFNHPDSKTVINMIVEGKIRYPDDLWRGISAEALNLVQSLLKRNPEERPSADEALQHPWILNGGGSSEPIHNDLTRLRTPRLQISPLNDGIEDDEIRRVNELRSRKSRR